MRTIFILDIQDAKHTQNLFSVLIYEYLYGKIISNNKYFKL